MSIHFFSSYTQAPGDAGPRVTRAFLTAKISKLQEATRIPPYTVRIPSVYHARIPAVYHRIPSVFQPYTIRIPCQYPSRIPPYTVRIPAVYHPYTTMAPNFVGQLGTCSLDSCRGCNLMHMVTVSFACADDGQIYLFR